MNEQQLQQILTIQQAIAAAATAAVINSLLNPQQAAGLANANALTDVASNDLQQQLQLRQDLQSPANTISSSPANSVECNNRIQDLLLQLQQHASGANSLQNPQTAPSPLALNLNAQQQQSLGAGLRSPSRSPLANSRLTAQDLQAVLASAAAAAAAANTTSTITPTSNTTTQQSNQPSPIKKLKRHHQQAPFNQHNRTSTEATSKSQHHLTPKNHSTISNLNTSGGRNSAANNSSSSSSSSTFITNNVGLPRKLVRGQDVWLGRGAEQTRQILKCMWCGQSFRTLAEMTHHMKITQHYTNIISQEQITSWRQPESSETKLNKHNAHQVRSLDDNQDDSSDKFNDSDREDTFSNEDDLDQHKHRSASISQQQTLEHNKSESVDNISTSDSNQGDLADLLTDKHSPEPKPLTRSKKRENEIVPIKHESPGIEKSPTSLSPSQRQSNPGSENSNDGTEANKASSKISNGNSEEETAIDKLDEEVDNRKSISDNEDSNDKTTSNDAKTNGDSTVATTSSISTKTTTTTSNEIAQAEDLKVKNEDSNDSTSNDNNAEIESEGNDFREKLQQQSEMNESATTSTNTTSAKSGGGQVGDPLSALETMVEKSFDPRLRPGVANGGILQRLGIDEEVCPPWQHINYANWYAAAAYGHPMAAALLAAGINLQNGIKLSKNMTPKKNED